MNKSSLAFLLMTAAAVAVGSAPASAQDKPLLGVVSITATEANNARYIKGAEKAAAERGWEVAVIDAQGSADQANAGIQNFVQRKAHGDRRHGLPGQLHRRRPCRGRCGEDPGGDLGRRPRRQRHRHQRHAAARWPCRSST